LGLRLGLGAGLGLGLGVRVRVRVSLVNEEVGRGGRLGLGLCW
jgi:hypothetical protein